MKWSHVSSYTLAYDIVRLNRSAASFLCRQALCSIVPHHVTVGPAAHDVDDDFAIEQVHHRREIQFAVALANTIFLQIFQI